MNSYFIFAGETSGDLHGSGLIQALRKTDPSALISGVGGPRMRQAQMNCLINMEEFQVMGFSDVIASLPNLLKRFIQVRTLILKMKPDCVVLIDYPGFNLRLAKSLRKHGFQGKIVQYVCPSVWAHGKKRIDTLESHYDLLLTIYPFETKLFSLTKLKVEYIGNPLRERIDSHVYQPSWLTQIGLSPDRQLVALFPGSRLSEIRKNVPLQLRVAQELKLDHPHLHFAISCAQENLRSPLCDLISKGPLKLDRDISMIRPEDHYDLMKNCKIALAKSGTVTLELALHHVPSVIHYELSLLNYLFAKYILRLKLPHYCIANILSQSTLFPEFIGKNPSSTHLKRQLEEILIHQGRYEQIQADCEKLRHHLGNRSSDQYAAKAIQELMQC